MTTKKLQPIIDWSKKRSPVVYCVWEQETVHDYWDTSCKNAHSFMVGGPKENHYKYCPYCGHKVKVI